MDKEVAQKQLFPHIVCMEILYHTPLDMGSRFIRTLLVEKKVDHTLCFEKYWERRASFLYINPAGTVPVFKTDELVLCGVQPIVEFLEETIDAPPKLGSNNPQRAESRRLIEWFLRNFHRDVLQPIVDETVMKRLLRCGVADPLVLRRGRANLIIHLKYMHYLLCNRGCLITETPTVADFIAAAALSCLDYLGEVPWQLHSEIKEWYARIKSRPSFKSLLMDDIPLFKPAEHYANLDF